MNRKWWALPAACLLMTTAALAATAAGPDEVSERIEQPVAEAIAARQQTQEEEEQWRRLQARLLAQLEGLQQEVGQLRRVEGELSSQVAAVEARLEQKNQQLRDIAQIQAEMDPFLEQLLARLLSLPGQGLPFLLEEREQRFSRLETTLQDPAISLSERYRKAMEALLIEAEFGLSLETYQQTLPIGGRPLLVDIFRLGRLGLFYLTLDRSACGFFNVATDAWSPLDKGYLRDLETAVAIAAKQRPVELLTMPLGRMVQP
ncbi:DUF3450 domain-containing protein [Desulfogranum mediterraneum]|uniref:DUF3450 domain-containing protein n=1 Tax=Desulfogranum mediterraneum TaxID=160661 RepID=UPI0003FFEDC6|nr:DUF3450 domain-containing protein [Desulfogranum mediterraneum]